MDATPDFDSQFPPNARISALTFDDARHMMEVSLDQGEALHVPAEAVIGLFGARIRRDTVLATKDASGVGRAVTRMAAGAALGIPMGMGKPKPQAGPAGTTEMHYAIAMRIEDVPEVWYLLASSFNFRKALGDKAVYATELNVRAFVRRLAAFCEFASPDAFFTATVARGTLPPPVESLLAFLRMASAV